LLRSPSSGKSVERLIPSPSTLPESLWRLSGYVSGGSDPATSYSNSSYLLIIFLLLDCLFSISIAGYFPPHYYLHFILAAQSSANVCLSGKCGIGCHYLNLTSGA